MRLVLCTLVFLPIQLEVQITNSQHSLLGLFSFVASLPLVLVFIEFSLFQVLYLVT